MKPKVSVIIPLYNKAPYVRKAVESVLAQSYEDWELVVVNDGSTDGSDMIVSEYIDERVRIVSQDNQSVSAARNKGVELAKAELIAFLDADDWWDERFLEEMIAFTEAYPNAGLWACNYWYVKRGKTRVAVKQESGYFDYAESYLRNEAMPVWTGAVVLPKKSFEQAGGFNPIIRMAEDFDLWIRIALTRRMAFLDKPLAYYNQDIDLSQRALGTLCSPEFHFVFNADYLSSKNGWDSQVQAAIDKVKITCLRQYYVSHKYHSLAKRELSKIQRENYRGYAFAQYLWQPLWYIRAKDWLGRIWRQIK